MYLMCGGLDKFGFKDDKEFVAALMKEEKVLILPGACFQYVTSFSSSWMRTDKRTGWTIT
jgi:aspartate/methionine/tyrosine aminotransferase